MDTAAYIRTDLASECVPSGAGEAEGVVTTETVHGNVSRTCTEIRTEEGAKQVGKPMGRYVMFGVGKLWLAGQSERDAVQELLCREIRSFAEALAPQAKSIFVAGLGNREITPDAVGPLTAGKVTVTRHVKKAEPELYRALGDISLSALSPGVTGQTGIETGELLKGAVAHIGPDLVIAVDALAARSADRLATSIQISDTGICPGSGVGNRRGEISQKTLGVPVLVIGIPTVVDSSTLIRDALEQAGMNDPPDALEQLLENGRSFFVTLKESDEAVRILSELLSAAIDQAFLNV